jgi:hypothetical protein
MLLHVLCIKQEKQNSCWHAAARMLYGYKRRQCIDPLPNTYQANAGLRAENFITLARSVGLRTLPQVNQCFDVTFLEHALAVYGPIWAAGQWYGPNHIVVVVGAEHDGTVSVNDPGLGLRRKQDIAWFNQKIDHTVPIPMMYLP